MSGLPLRTDCWCWRCCRCCLWAWWWLEDLLPGFLGPYLLGDPSYSVIVRASIVLKKISDGDIKLQNIIRHEEIILCNVTCLTGHWQSQPPRPGRGCPGTRRPTPSPRPRTASRWWWERTRRTRPAHTPSPSPRRYQPREAPGRHWNDNDSQKSCENWLLICNPY